VPAPPRLRFRRTEPRLDPVRWRRPGRGTLIRMMAVAALLTVGATAAWAGQPPCAAPSAGRATASTSARPLSRGTAGTTTTTTATPSGLSADRRAGDHPVPPGRVGVPVRLAEPTALSLVHPGDRVDLFPVDGAARGTSAVAVAAPVLDVTGADDPMTGALLLALSPSEAQSAIARQGGGFAVLIRPD
jgi:hypothetical protein